MVICSYCNKETFDEEFCDNCGKFLIKDECKDKEPTETISENEYNYSKEALNCITINSKLNKKDIQIFNSDRIQSPFYIKDEKLFFVDEDEITLEEYLDNNKLETMDIYELFYSFLEIFKVVENENLILGSINMSDFWVKNNDLSTLFYRQSRRFLTHNDSFENYEISKISSPEVANRNAEYINEKTDIYLLGKIFIRLIYSNINIENYEHERFISYNLELFKPGFPRELHTWLNKTTTIFQEDRYNTVSECVDSFHSIDTISNIRLLLSDNSKELLLDVSCITDTGKSKKIDISSITDAKDLLEAQKKSLKSNEDSYLILTNENKTFAMVADGVSNCKFGTGFDASNIVSEVCTKLWNEKHFEINNENDIKDFINKIIEESNKNILKHVIDDVEDVSFLKSGIMATTFSSAIIINGVMYYVTLGDSPIYILNNGNISLLSVEDNQGNRKIKDGLSWSKYINLEDKSHLVKFIGGDFALNYIDNNDNQKETIDFEVKKLNLLNNDIVVICSDGLTDYINPISARDDIWNDDDKLNKIILEEDISLAEINQKLVDEANKNGGGDNITIILIKVKTMEDNI